jgi:hypothetical protein
MQRSSTAHRKEKQNKLTLKLMTHITEMKICNNPNIPNCQNTWRGPPTYYKDAD